jgi:hypothetical protein
VALTGRAALLSTFSLTPNLFDASWLDVSAQPAAGRASSIGVRVRR